MNFYDAELVRENGRYAVALENARVELSEDKQANLERNQVTPQPITLGVRPEHISLAADASRAVHGTVDVAEMMGSAVHLHVNACGSDTIIILQTMELHDEGVRSPPSGSALDFTFGGNVCHLFDRNTGRNLEQVRHLTEKERHEPLCFDAAAYRKASGQQMTGLPGHL